MSSPTTGRILRQPGETAAAFPRCVGPWITDDARRANARGGACRGLFPATHPGRGRQGIGPRTATTTPLVRLRQSAGLSIRTAAERAGFKPANLWHLEQTGNPTAATMIKLAFAYGVPPSVVFAAVTAGRMEATG